MSDNRYRFLLIGAVIGGVLGMAAAWLAADALDEQAQLQELDVAAIRIQPRARQQRCNSLVCLVKYNKWQ